MEKNWYYTSGGEHSGPVDEAMLKDLKARGVIFYETLVWREGMKNWEPYGKAVEAPSPSSVPPGARGYGAENQSEPSGKIPSHLALAIIALCFSLLMCCSSYGLGLVTFVLSIIALVKASQVSNHVYNGNYPLAMSDSRTARTLSLISIVINALILLLVVFILVLIAVPNYIEAEARYQISRARSDLRSMSTGVEAYAADHQAYPPDANMLTTPVAFLYSIPGDVFSDNCESLKYWSGVVPEDNGKAFAVFWSIGPDAISDITPESISDRLLVEPDRPETGFIDLEYDSTNGSRSDGDIFIIRSKDDYERSRDGN